MARSPFDLFGWQLPSFKLKRLAPFRKLPVPSHIEMLAFKAICLIAIQSCHPLLKLLPNCFGYRFLLYMTYVHYTSYNSDSCLNGEKAQAPCP
jgi:hypothetical protein